MLPETLPLVTSLGIRDIAQRLRIHKVYLHYLVTVGELAGYLEKYKIISMTVRGLNNFL